MLLRLAILENTENTALMSLILDTDIEEQPSWARDDNVQSILEQSTDEPLDTILTPTTERPSYAQVSRIGTTSMFHYSRALKPLITEGNSIDLTITDAYPTTDHSSIVFKIQDPET